MFPSRRGQTSHFSVFVLELTDPVHLRILTDSFMERVDHHHFVPFGCPILGDPVTVHDPHIRTRSTHSFLCNVLQVLSVFDLIDSLNIEHHTKIQCNMFLERSRNMFSKRILRVRSRSVFPERVPGACSRNIPRTYILALNAMD